MTALRRAEDAGFRVDLDGGHVVVTGPKTRAELVAELRRHRDEIVAILQGRACCRCGAHGVALVGTYWTLWRRSLCQSCVAAVAEEFDRRDAWPVVPSELIGDEP